MAGDTQSSDSVAGWPLPKFHFTVAWSSSGLAASFSEVSGLSVESEPIEYRHGNSAVFSKIKMPGLQKVGNVTMKKGMFKSDNHFWTWFEKIKMNTIARETVTISLLDEQGGPTMVWTLQNAWPSKITSTDLKSDGNEVAIEQIDIVFETLTIANG